MLVANVRARGMLRELAVQRAETEAEESGESRDEALERARREAREAKASLPPRGLSSRGLSFARREAHEAKQAKALALAAEAEAAAAAEAEAEAMAMAAAEAEAKAAAAVAAQAEAASASVAAEAEAEAAEAEAAVAAAVAAAAVAVAEEAKAAAEEEEEREREEEAFTLSRSPSFLDRLLVEAESWEAAAAAAEEEEEEVAPTLSRSPSFMDRLLVEAEAKEEATWRAQQGAGNAATVEKAAAAEKMAARRAAENELPREIERAQAEAWRGRREGSRGRERVVAEREGMRQRERARCHPMRCLESCFASLRTPQHQEPVPALIPAVPLPPECSAVTYAIHKPRGVLSAARDANPRRRTLIDVMIAAGVEPLPGHVGRLDLETSGLILVTAGADPDPDPNLNLESSPSPSPNPIPDPSPDPSRSASLSPSPTPTDGLLLEAALGRRTGVKEAPDSSLTKTYELLLAGRQLRGTSRPRRASMVPLYGECGERGEPAWPGCRA